MNKADLLALDEHAHLTFAELARAKPELAAKLEPKLDAKLADAIASTLKASPEPLRDIAGSEAAAHVAGKLRARDVRSDTKLADIMAYVLHKTLEAQHEGE